MRGLFGLLGKTDESKNTFTLDIKVNYISDIKHFKSLLSNNSSRLTISSNGIETFIFRRSPKKLRTHKKQLTQSESPPHLEKKAKEFQKLLDKHHWTRAELARKLKVSRAWVSIVLNHRNRSSK